MVIFRFTLRGRFSFLYLMETGCYTIFLVQLLNLKYQPELLEMCHARLTL